MINKIDREFIENKYHSTDKSFNSLNRMAYHGIGYAEETGKDDVEILAGLKAMQPELSVMPHPVARATAINMCWKMKDCILTNTIILWGFIR